MEPASLSKLVLRKTQRNEVLQLIQQAGLDPSGFHWAEEVKERTIMGPDAAFISRLRHIPTGYSFSFDMRGEIYWASYFPGRESPKAFESCDSWRDILIHVSQWLQVIKIEYEAPDLWEHFRSEPWLFQVTVEADEERFSLRNHLKTPSVRC